LGPKDGGASAGALPQFFCAAFDIL
jgi:hypothetical protein